MNKEEAIHLLKELAKEHKEFWVEMDDETSPKIIQIVIEFIKEENTLQEKVKDE